MEGGEISKVRCTVRSQWAPGDRGFLPAWAGGGLDQAWEDEERGGTLLDREASLSRHAGTVYDYKSPTLEAIRMPLHAQELAGAIITGGRTHRNSSDSFNQAAAGYLSSILYYYAVKYGGPEPVTLPHVFAILLTHETGDIVETLETDIESKMLLSTVRDSRGASEQMAGILATLKNRLTPLVSRDVFFALSGKESLAVNDPGSPRVLVLSNGEEVRRALNPLISTVLKMLMRLINKPGQYPCVFCTR